MMLRVKDGSSPDVRAVFVGVHTLRDGEDAKPDEEFATLSLNGLMVMRRAMSPSFVREVAESFEAFLDVAPTGQRLSNFGSAIERLKRGERVWRRGWNGKGMWLVLIKPGNAMHTSQAGSFDMQECIGMKTAEGGMQPGWLASQADMLAEDWVLEDADWGPADGEVVR